MTTAQRPTTSPPTPPAPVGRVLIGPEDGGGREVSVTRVSAGGIAARAPRRVVFGVRADLESSPGGDTIQILRTAEALRAIGVRVDCRGPGEMDAGADDVAHIWHLERVHESYDHLVDARRQGASVVLSTIYWPSDGRPHSWRRRGWRENAKNVVRLIKSGSPAVRSAVARAILHGWSACRRDLLLGADMLLPNSAAEGKVLEAEARLAGGSPPPWRAVCNAVDVRSCEEASGAAVRTTAQRRGIVSVGHFDPRKNQLQLIRALAATGRRVVFVGAARRMHGRYYRACERLAAGAHEFLGPRTPAEALAILARAAVHVCPSVLETPGLANLEAAAVGCALVVPECPPVREYFADDAEYFAPGDAGSLLAAIDRALAVGPRDHLAARVRAEFSWSRAARQTLDAYQEAMSRHEA